MPVEPRGRGPSGLLRNLAEQLGERAERLRAAIGDGAGLLAAAVLTGGVCVLVGLVLVSVAVARGR